LSWNNIVFFKGILLRLEQILRPLSRVAKQVLLLSNMLRSTENRWLRRPGRYVNTDVGNLYYALAKIK
jgi:hypothetical protein